MLLAVDVGNTQTVFGLYDGPELGERWRIATEAERTGDELGALLGDFLDLPLRSYSTGMTMRLAFSVATSSEGSGVSWPKRCA